jgi:endonuclease YncB( thermonuclease family)
LSQIQSNHEFDKEFHDNRNIELYDVTVTLQESNKPVNVVYNDTVPFIPPISGGIVVKVYDGDTITIAAKLPYTESPMYRFSIRLNGIDTPEIKGKTNEEKLLAKNARDAMANLIMNKYVTLRNCKTEKYGRILADVFVFIDNEEIHLNQWMLDNKYAVKYDGGTKIRPTNWDS